MKYILILNIVLLVVTKNYAQDNIGSDQQKEQLSISLNPLLIVSEELGARIEFPIAERKNISLQAGYIFPNQTLDGVFHGFHTESVRYAHTGISLNTGYQYFLSSSSPFFLESNIIYKYKLINSGTYNTDEDEEFGLENNFLFDRTTQILQCKFNIGHRKNRSNNFFSEFYFGAGIKVKFINQSVNDIIIGDPGKNNSSRIFDNRVTDNYDESGIYLLPTIHLGFRYGRYFAMK